ncbi:hypothetical protein PVAG01_00415 [Phlyctema vagabunda]|uniref:Ppe family protein n=1 Tax=Phlyctema vagabunda TaxID=108571 RepID=A0ABR4PVL4_9HELO
MKLGFIVILLSFISLSFALPIAIQKDGPARIVARQRRFGKMPSSRAVMAAASNFANDANTVSASLNSMGTETDPRKIRSLATAAFNAESDEDAQRAVLAAAAGSAGTAPNAKIVKNTPAVLDGLSNIMKSPNTRTTKSNVATIEAARNPQILPSITSLSNSALKAVGMPATAQTFPATTASKAAAAAAAADN